MRVAVVGAGVVGAAVARAAALRGAEVTVFERGHPGVGTSGTTFGWVNAHNKEPESYFALNRAGMRAHAELQRAEPSPQSWYFPDGNLEWAVDAGHVATLTATIERLTGHGYPAEWIGRDRARALAPDARIPDGAAIAWFGEEGLVSPAPLLARLLGEARDHGALILTGHEARRVSAGEVGATIDLADGGPAGGARQTFDTVVTCVGRWTGPLLAAGGVTVHMVDPHAPGAAAAYLGYTDPVPARLSCLLTTPRLNVRPDGAGRLIVQALDLDATADPARGPDPAVRSELEDRLCAVLDGAEHARVREVRVGQRALPADGYTAAGFVDASRRHYTIATHSGMTLCLHLADLAVTEILDGTDDPALLPFRPARLAAIPAAPAPPPARHPGEQ